MSMMTMHTLQNAVVLAICCLLDGAIHMFEDRSPRRDISHSGDVVINDKPVASWVPHSCPVYSLAFEDPWLVSASRDGKLAMMDVRKLLKLSSNVKFEKFANCHSWKSIGRQVTIASIEACVENTKAF
jgi:hypothetical protein